MVSPAVSRTLRYLAGIEDPEPDPLPAPALVPPVPFDPDQGPREALPGSVGAQPIISPLSPNPEPVAPPASPYDAPQPFRPTPSFQPSPLIGQPAPPMVRAEAPPSWEARTAAAAVDAAAPTIQTVAGVLGRVAPALGSLAPGITAATAAARAAPSAVSAASPVLGAALDTYTTANEWLINNPITGQLNPQAWGRELGGTDQLNAEVGEDLARLQALIRRYQAGDTSVEPDMRALNDSINARVAPSGVSNRDVLLAAGERNPNKTAENLGQAVQAGATMAIAPSLAAGPARNIVGAALDPLGQGLGAALELPGRLAPAFRGMPSPVAGIRGALADNAQAALEAPGVVHLGSGVVPEPGSAAAARAAADAAAGRPASTVAKYQALANVGVDTPQELARHIETGPVTTTETARRMLGDRPEYLQPVAQFLLEQRQKLMSGAMTARDVGKAYYMTMMSMRAQLQNATEMEGKLARGFTTGAGQVVPPNPEMGNLDGLVNPRTGQPLGPLFAEVDPETGGRVIRPESLGAAWAWTADGQRALDGLSAGQFDADAWRSGQRVRQALGMDTVGGNGVLRPLTAAEVAAGKVNMTNLPAFVEELNQGIARMRAQGREADIGPWMTEQARRLMGIGEAKTAFVKQLLGMGDGLTIDAREINYWLGGRGLLTRNDVSRGAETARAASAWWTDPRVASAVRARIERAVGELTAAHPDLLEGIGPDEAGEIIHHWIWDKSAGSETTHAAEMLTQRLAAGAAPRAGRGLGTDAYNAAQGGVLGGTSEVLQAQEEGRDVDPAEMARRALLGGGLAAAGGRYARRGAAAGARLGMGVVPEGVPSMPNSAAARGIDALYHETSPREAFMLTNEIGTNALQGMYVSPDPTLALGQRGRGALIEFGDTDQIGVVPARAKPGARMLEATGQGTPELTVQATQRRPREHIRSIVVAPDARMDPVARGIARALERQGWTVDALPDGGRRYRPPTTTTPTEGVQHLGSGVVPQAAGQAGRAAQSPNPHIRGTARQMQGQYLPSGVAARPLAERVISALFDKHAIVGNVEQDIQGRVAAAGGQAPATRLAERVRENPNSIAAQRAREELAPALQAVGEDADWLEQVLVHTHNVDIAAQKGQEAYDAAIAAGRSPQRAQAIADRVRTSRLFSGGMTEQDLHDALADIQVGLGSARWQRVQAAAQAVWDTGRKSLDEKLAEGMISPALHQELTTRYPHYVRTDIADYFEAGPAAPSPGGTTMGISSVGITPISAVGTTKDRVNPLLSTIDALYGHEAAMTRNAAAQDLAQLRDADPTARGLFKEVAPDAAAFRANRTEMVPPDYSLRNGEQKLTAWEHGEARQFIIPAEYAALLSPRQGALLGDSALASGTRSFFGLWKSLITTHNPAFQMVVSPFRDAGDYAVGEATRSATRRGPLGAAQAIGALPGVVVDYLKALPAAFQGLGKGQLSQEVADLRRAGAGFEGRPARTDAGLREAYADLRASGGVALRTPADLARTARTILTLGAEPIGSRLELVPRIAAARRAAGRGADELGQAMAFKDATIDFLRGGWLTQQLNVVVPFINPTVQSSAQVARLAQKNPAAAAAAVGTAIGVPAMLADAWNRSDEQRAADYANVPDSVKNTGIVWMLPDTVGPVQIAGSTDLGERKPNYLWVPLGSFAFAARLAREGLALADPVTGLQPGPERPGRRVTSPLDAAARAAEVGGDILAMFSPVKGEGISSSVASLIPPVASEAIEVGFNTDFYRGSRVATDPRDERASRLSQGVAGAANWLGNTDQVRPSQVEHVVRGVGGYAGQLAAAASDLGRDRGERRPIQDVPIAGGLVSRVVRDTGGQRLEDAESTAARVPEGVRSVLAQAGMRSDELPPVGRDYLGGPLTRDEQLAWQQATNALAEAYVQDAVGSSKWADPTTREAAVRAALTKARTEAAKQANLPSRSEMRERARTVEQRRAG